MKTKFKFKTTDQKIPVTIIMQDELRHVIHAWLRGAKEMNMSIYFIKKRIAFLNRSISKHHVKLFKVEIEWLYEYWVKRVFNEGEDTEIKQRRKYCEDLIGKKEAKLLFNKITKCLHEQNLGEDEDAEEVPFPVFWGDSDFGQ